MVNFDKKKKEKLVELLEFRVFLNGGGMTSLKWRAEYRACFL